METHSKKDKPHITLVLSMGGARGIAHIGVIEELLAQGYVITSLAGSSMGAMVGAMYATGKLEECKDWFCTWNKQKMWQLADLSLSSDGLVKGDRFIRELKQILPDVNIEDLPLPYVALATDIVSEQEVKFTSSMPSEPPFPSQCSSAHSDGENKDWWTEASSIPCPSITPSARRATFWWPWT